MNGVGREILLAVPACRLEWQLVHRFHQPVFVEKGSRLTVTVLVSTRLCKRDSQLSWPRSTTDNSPNNPANPDPAQSIRWGDKSEQAMMTGWIEYVDAPATRSRANNAL